MPKTMTLVEYEKNIDIVHKDILKSISRFRLSKAFSPEELYKEAILIKLRAQAISSSGMKIMLQSMQGKGNQQSQIPTAKP